MICKVVSVYLGLAVLLQKVYGHGHAYSSQHVYRHDGPEQIVLIRKHKHDENNFEKSQDQDEPIHKQDEHTPMDSSRYIYRDDDPAKKVLNLKDKQYGHDLSKTKSNDHNNMKNFHGHGYTSQQGEDDYQRDGPPQALFAPNHKYVSQNFDKIKSQGHIKEQNLHGPGYWSQPVYQLRDQAQEAPVPKHKHVGHSFSSQHVKQKDGLVQIAPTPKFNQNIMSHDYKNINMQDYWKSIKQNVRGHALQTNYRYHPAHEVLISKHINKKTPTAQIYKDFHADPEYMIDYKIKSVQKGGNNCNKFYPEYWNDNVSKEHYKLHKHNGNVKHVVKPASLHTGFNSKVKYKKHHTVPRHHYRQEHYFY